MDPAQIDEYLRADVDFHFAIATAAGNPILGQFHLLRNLMRGMDSRALAQPEARRKPWRNIARSSMRFGPTTWLRRGKPWKPTSTLQESA